MAGRRVAHCAGLMLAVIAAVRAPAVGDENAIVADITAFFRTDDLSRRQQLVARILADPAYDRAQVRAWLHQADLFPAHEPGFRPLEVALHDGTKRSVTLRIPAGYDPRRPWPLIYALHGSGGRGEDIIRYLEHVLGADINQFIVAAPTGYADLIIHQSEWPPTGEHPAILRAVRQAVNVDGSRVYLAGYSRGGHTTWTVAVLHADEFAGAVSLAGTFTLLLRDKMWDAFLPNLAHLSLLGVWGAHDDKDAAGAVGPDGGVAGMNRKLRSVVDAVKPPLPITLIELPDKAHVDVVPPADELHKVLTQTRVAYPPAVRHTFRHLCQGRTYWLEAHAWRGEQWDDTKRTVRLREGEKLFSNDDVDQAVLRTYRGLLAELSGTVRGQVIRVDRRRIGELTVWIGEEMIDWSQPVTLNVGGRTEFAGRLEPDLGVCLMQAARTWDFDRLRWAGLRFRSGANTRLVSMETEFSDPFSAATAKR